MAGGASQRARARSRQQQVATTDDTQSVEKSLIHGEPMGGGSDTDPEQASGAGSAIRSRIDGRSRLAGKSDDQYWSALRISPPARVTRLAINWTDATSLMKWTEPSTNRALAPPGWNA